MELGSPSPGFPAHYFILAETNLRKILDSTNVQAYVAYKISKMQHLNTRHFWLSVFCCIYLTLIGGFLIYVAFESVWTCLAISILNIVLTIPPFIVKGKTNRLIFSLASFSVTFSTVMLTLGAYCIISIDNDYLFVYWFVVLVAHILISQLVTWRRIKHGYYLNVNVRKKVGFSTIIGVYQDYEVSK